MTHLTLCDDLFAIAWNIVGMCVMVRETQLQFHVVGLHVNNSKIKFAADMAFLSALGPCASMLLPPMQFGCLLPMEARDNTHDDVIPFDGAPCAAL